MTPANSVSVTIGGLTLRVGDLQGYKDSKVILANGMEIKASTFEIELVKKQLKERVKTK